MAASTSAAVACVTFASGSAVAGFTVSKGSPGAVKAPSTKRPSARPCASSHFSAGPAASGAGPYSIDFRTSATRLVLRSFMRPSPHRMPEGGGVGTRHVVLELPLDVPEERARPEAQPLRREPLVAQLLLHQDQPVEGLLRGAEPPRRLEAH